MFVVINICLLADAKFTKDISEDFFCIYCAACDFSEMVETLAEVFGNEVTGEILF